MPRRDPRPRHRKGAVAEVELDRSITLYGVEDWTQIRDDPLIEIRWRTPRQDDTGAGRDDADGTATAEGDVSR